MARWDLRHPANAEGPWFVDTTCIDCDASRQCAPSLVGEVDGQSVFLRQPRTDDERTAAARAMLACPTASIGVRGERPPTEGLFPQLLDGDVYYCGFNSPDSFGANAFFAADPTGSRGGGVLVDSPRFVPRLARRLEALGGVRDVVLTHRDDVADAGRWAARLGARVWIHEADRDAVPFATDILRGDAPSVLRPGLVAIPAPGHTRGSVLYLLENRFLFTGDSLHWSRTRGDLSAFRGACWYSWEAQARSLARLAESGLPFEWVLAGHGDRRRGDPDELRRRLRALVARMERDDGEGEGDW